jgi:TrmH family RNA methyltransferase
LLSKTRIIRLKSLHKKKFRRIENKFLLEGHRLIDQALSTNTEIEEVWITNKSNKSSIGEKLLHKIDNKNIPWSITPDKIIRQISDSLNDQGIIALSPIPIYKKYNKPPLQSIYLDGVSDPGNMGTILRTAAWFGIKSVFCSSDCVDPFNSKVVRSAMGAHYYFSHFDSVLYEKLFSDLSKNTIKIVGSDISGQSIDTLDLSDSLGWCLVLGNESHGISLPVRNFITNMVTIPGTENIESLNVSVAGGILLHALTSLKVVTN